MRQRSNEDILQTGHTWSPDTSHVTSNTLNSAKVQEYRGQLRQRSELSGVGSGTKLDAALMEPKTSLYGSQWIRDIVDASLSAIVNRRPTARLLSPGTASLGHPPVLSA
ncbi:unnamed protein product, partial [Iphiclides podalirius]